MTLSTGSYEPAPEECAIDSASPLKEDPRLQLIVESLQSKRGVDILVMDLRGISDASDYFVLCTGTSDLHVKSLSVAVVDELKKEGHRPWHVEGLNQRRWVLVDLVDIVIHVFSLEAREFYALERLWGDAPCTLVEEPEHVPSHDAEPWAPEAIR